MSFPQILEKLSPVPQKQKYSKMSLLRLGKLFSFIEIFKKVKTAWEIFFRTNFEIVFISLYFVPKRRLVPKKPKWPYAGKTRFFA